MKKILFISPLILVILCIASCNKSTNPPSTPVDDPIDTANASIVYMGTFMNGPYGSVSGNVKIYENDEKRSLRLENFSTSSGPDLHVYVSQEIQPIHFVDLGNIKSTMGNQTYDLAANVDLNLYKYGLIHCQEYNHLFGSAELKK